MLQEARLMSYFTHATTLLDANARQLSVEFGFEQNLDDERRDSRALNMAVNATRHRCRDAPASPVFLESCKVFSLRFQQSTHSHLHNAPARLARPQQRPSAPP